MEQQNKTEPAHVQRMVAEYDRLSDDVNKLYTFINDSPIFKKLDEYEKVDMELQHFHMSHHLAILKRRIDRARGKV